MDTRAELQGFDISDKSAAVIGCGGLGCNIATHLACAGIGRLVLCDFDYVSESNLNRQFLYTVFDVGKEKAALAKERLKAVSPETELISVNKKIISPDDLAFAADADVLFLAVDNNAARAAAGAFCSCARIPLINGGVNGFYGVLYAYIPGATPDLAAAGMLSKETQGVLSVSSTVGVIGALAAHTGIRLLLGDFSSAGKLHVFDDGEIHTLKIREKETFQ